MTGTPRDLDPKFKSEAGAKPAEDESTTYTAYKDEDGKVQRITSEEYARRVREEGW